MSSSTKFCITDVKYEQRVVRIQLMSTINITFGSFPPQVYVIVKLLEILLCLASVSYSNYGRDF